VRTLTSYSNALSVFRSNCRLYPVLIRRLCNIFSSFGQYLFVKKYPILVFQYPSLICSFQPVSAFAPSGGPMTRCRQPALSVTSSVAVTSSGRRPLCAGAQPGALETGVNYRRVDLFQCSAVARGVEMSSGKLPPCVRGLATPLLCSYLPLVCVSRSYAGDLLVKLHTAQYMPGMGPPVRRSHTQCGGFGMLVRRCVLLGANPLSIEAEIASLEIKRLRDTGQILFLPCCCSFSL